MTTHTLDIIYYAIHWLSMACFLVVVAFVIVTAIKIWARSAPKAGGVLHHVPTVWTLRSLFESANSVQRGSIVQDGFYVPARPQVNIGGLRWRLKCSWLAFTGRCDLVRWPEGQ